MRLVSTTRVRADEAAPTECELVLERVRLRLERRVAWLGHLGEHRGVREPTSLELPSFDSPYEEAMWLEHAQELRAASARLEAVEHALERFPESRFAILGTRFGLGSPELDLLQLLFAVEIEPRLGRVLGALHPSGRAIPTAGIATRLFGYGHENLLANDSALYEWELVHVGEPVAGEQPPLACNAYVRDWLRGVDRMDAQLSHWLRPIATHPPLRHWPVAEVLETIHRSFEREIPLRVILSGPSGVGRRTLAALVLEQLGSQALGVDASSVREEDWPRFFMLCQRFATLQQVGLVWVDLPSQRSWPTHVPTTMLQMITCREGEPVARDLRAADHRFELHAPTSSEALELWGRLLPESRTWPADSVQRLVASHHLTIGELVDVWRRAPSSLEQAEAMVRELGRGRLGDLAQNLAGSFGWDDLVVSDHLRDALQAFAFEALDRAAFWESSAARRLFPRGTGLVGLMAGPPGTGKTMAAQVIARELGLDLYRIDLATVVSKYIGETAKNLRQIFQRASRLNAMLLFDEADAMFAKRTELKDSHDRHANADTGYLLQLLEQYRGVALLASNRRGNIDPAFIRRIRYVFTFPRPDVAQRVEIWQRVVGELCPEAQPGLSSTLERLGAVVTLSGAEIKNAVLAALFHARRRGARLSTDDLFVGVDRELAKEGMSMSAENRRVVRRHG
ncbi:ATP-binding protein [Paraliomyxa miuraensis]|uniref:ATP-binding protein n=1 Tax=Paraliomyxa miuraensis TaxID=376150 RepID=UPI00224CC184|nr:AAA family ATPase [Paraliomyxa miuraensis]MCX4247469.1 AAA family ATPase [Paraliomyxa miuraensis]